MLVQFGVTVEAISVPLGDSKNWAARIDCRNFVNACDYNLVKTLGWHTMLLLAQSLLFIAQSHLYNSIIMVCETIDSCKDFGFELTFQLYSSKNMEYHMTVQAQTAV